MVNKNILLKHISNSNVILWNTSKLWNVQKIIKLCALWSVLVSGSIRFSNWWLIVSWYRTCLLWCPTPVRVPCLRVALIWIAQSAGQILCMSSLMQEYNYVLPILSQKNIGHLNNCGRSTNMAKRAIVMWSWEHTSIFDISLLVIWCHGVYEQTCAT